MSPPSAIPPHLGNEQIQRAYVQAVVAHAGATIFIPNTDIGIDLFFSKTIRTPAGKYIPVGISVFCQLRATIDYTVTPDEIIYDLDASTYNTLAAWQGDSPCYLILYCLPKDHTPCLSHTEDELLLRHCCYWLSIHGPLTDNTSTKRVQIPRRQMLTPDTIQQLLQRA